MNWFSRKKRDSNLEPMQGQSREEANSGLDEAQRAREQLALESMRSLTESLRRMKSAEDRAEYSKIERIRGAVAGKAGASPAAQAAVIRLNEEAEAANDRIAASELKGDFQQLVLDFTAINSRDHDQTLTDKSKELETLKGVRSNQKLAQDKSLARAEAHAEKERDQAKDRVARDKKHYVADSYQKLAGGIGRINQHGELKEEDYATLLAACEKRYAALNEMRQNEYAGDSENINKAIAAVEAQLTELRSKYPAGRAKNEQNEAVKTIKDQKNTPLETLIKREKNLKGTAEAANTQGNKAKNADYIPDGQGIDRKMIKTEEAVKMTTGDVMKGKIKGIPGQIKDGFTGGKDKLFKAKEKLEGLKNWGEALDAVQDQISGTYGDVTGFIEDPGDVTEMKELAKGFMSGEKSLSDVKGDVFDDEFDNSAVGIIGGVLSGIASVVTLSKTLVALVKAIRNEYKSGKDGGDVTIDNQGRFQQVRGFVHKAADIMEGFGDTFGPLTQVIPFYDSIVGLCQGSIAMAGDTMDLVTSSMGIHSMRKYRDKIYQRIQERRALYTADETRDRKAASAYNVTGKKGLEKKRHELEREAAIKGEKTGAVRIVAASSRRSKNDTIFREAQYGLGERIQATEDVGDQRRLEAMEMMEEYREADQAHKKNVKALLHNVEAIVKGGIGITSSGMSLAGEIACMTGVGAAVGLALKTASGVMDLGSSIYEKGREAGSFVYKSVRTLTGAEDNKNTVREDMAISLMERMEEVSASPIWTTDNKGFAEDQDLYSLGESNTRQLFRQSHNVEHLHQILRKGLDTDMPDLLESESRADLKGKLAAAFGQGDD